jgi:hypothetical protein
MKIAASVAICFGMAVTVCARAGAPFSFDRAPGRLPKNVVPISYTVAVVPNLDTLTLAGTESVTLQFRSASDTIVFNSLNETLTDVRLDAKPVAQVVSDDEQQLTRVTLAQAATRGSHTLTFVYSGRLESQPHGLFLQYYQRLDGSRGRMLSTKMESTDARRMFPCWDEPAFRSSFELSVTIPARLAGGVQHAGRRRVRGGRHGSTITFQRSPRCRPTWWSSPPASWRDRRPQRRGRTGRLGGARQEQDGATALANAQQILADYDDYFGYRYPLPKLDSIAVPGGFGGAMENWGAITYNDQLLLLSASSTIGNRQRCSACRRTRWHTSGTATWSPWAGGTTSGSTRASPRGAPPRRPTCAIPAGNGGSCEDARQGSRDERRCAPVVARDPAARHRRAAGGQRLRSGDHLQQGPGGAAHVRGLPGSGPVSQRRAPIYPRARVFQRHQRGSVERAQRAGGGGAAAAAAAAAEVSAVPAASIGAIASDWTERPGFPLVGVTASCDAAGRRTVTLAQQRFLLRGSDAAASGPAASHWSVPLQVRAGSHGTPQSVLLMSDGQSSAAGRCDEPLSVNADAIGFYRVRYDQATYQTNAGEFCSTAGRRQDRPAR